MEANEGEVDDVTMEGVRGDEFDGDDRVGLAREGDDDRGGRMRKDGKLLSIPSTLEDRSVLLADLQVAFVEEEQTFEAVLIAHLGEHFENCN